MLVTNIRDWGRPAQAAEDLANGTVNQRERPYLTATYGNNARTQLPMHDHNVVQMHDFYAR
jgi:hypothetical protein